MEGEALGDGHFAAIVGRGHDATAVVRIPLSIRLQLCEGQWNESWPWLVSTGLPTGSGAQCEVSIDAAGKNEASTLHGFTPWWDAHRAGLADSLAA